MRDHREENIACKITHVTFAISGEALDVEHLSAETGVEPSWSFAKGDNFDSGGVQRKREYGVWAVTTERLIDSSSTEQHAQYLLKILEPVKDVLLSYVNAQDYRSSVRIWWEAIGEHGGYTVSSETMVRLCALCQEIDTTFIAWPEDDSE